MAIALLVLKIFGLPALIVGVLLFFPEKIEKWSALFWKGLHLLHLGVKSAHKTYVKHDLQGRVNDFVRRLKKHTPSLASEKLKIEWVNQAASRESFIADGHIVLRLRRDDPDDYNFVHGAYLFISSSLLSKAKRYLAVAQKEALDLYVCSKVVEQEKPTVVGIFLDAYMHPKTRNKTNNINSYLDDFAIIDSAKLFFPIFMQELQYLGDKVFGRRQDETIRAEVNNLITFLKPVATRNVGDENELRFAGAYCRFGIVIIGRKIILIQSIRPYVNYIQREIVNNNAETIYIIGAKVNKEKMLKVCEVFDDKYEVVSEMIDMCPLNFHDHKEVSATCFLILRRRTLPIVRPSTQLTEIGPKDARDI